MIQLYKTLGGIKKMNLFWPVYKNLEKEFLALANYIHIDDSQMKVYSMHIADLIIRTCVEIESISKELYFKLGGCPEPVDEDGKKRDLYFDTDCLNLLEQEWHISKKQITVSCSSLFLSKDENTILTPLHKAYKRGTSGSKWQQVYQAVKHNRVNSLKRATLSVLINALGALYILNLYYRDEIIDIGRMYLSDKTFDNRVGSDIFSVCYFSATGLFMSTVMDDSCISNTNMEELEKAIYVHKYTDDTFIQMHENFCRDYKITLENFEKSKVIADFLKNNPDYTGKSINEICMVAGGQQLMLSIVSTRYSRSDLQSTKSEAKLNKHKDIYPHLDPIE